jgi:hypothetical protein
MCAAALGYIDTPPGPLTAGLWPARQGDGKFAPLRRALASSARYQLSAVSADPQAGPGIAPQRTTGGRQGRGDWIDELGSEIIADNRQSQSQSHLEFVVCGVAPLRF